MNSLLHAWTVGQRDPNGLPSYEEVVLGNLGRNAAGAALVTLQPVRGYAFAWSGERFAAWLGQPTSDLALAALSSGDARVFTRACAEATSAKRIVSARRILLHAGTVETSEFTAYPLRNRFGETLVLLHTSGEVVSVNLVDAIFSATQQGMLALSAVRAKDDSVVDFEVVALNEATAALMAKPTNELLWHRLSVLVPGLESTDAPAQLREVLRTGERRAFEFAYRTRLTDREIFLRVEAGAVGDLLAVTLTDINPIRQREASYRLLFESNPMPMWLYDRKTHRFLAVNQAAVRHYGYQHDEFLEMTLFDLRPQEDWPALRTALSRDVQSNDEHLWRHRKADGTLIDVSVYARAVRYGDRPAVLVAVLDVTERRRAEARIVYLAHHDALTDLPNRVFFTERLTQALRHRGDEAGQPPLAVLCLDLDGFKFVNDTLGHAGGDELLAAVAGRLRGFVHAQEDCVARLGGDEFALLRHSVPSPEAAGALAQQIVEILSAPYGIQGQEVVIGVSVGVALAPSDADTPEFLLRNADMALYRAKADGRRTYRFFEAGMDARLQARRQLEQDLRTAFQSGQLELHYQPVLDASTGRVSGCEALLRWTHPVRGAISPAEFVPLAEEIGLIGPIGDWALRQACAEAVHWPAEVRIAVNLSPAQFRAERNLVQSVFSALAQSGLSPTRLELEITETVFLADNEGNLATLHRLRALGVRIAMDDFGTGYSSLSYLRAFPFDKIKIDRSFVRDLGSDPQSGAIVEAVTRLASRLSIRTTAEGVETEGQAALLRAEGCHELQGFLFSRALPSAAVREFIRGLRGQCGAGVADEAGAAA
ncbi:EAL domain-containing protein [Methylobacterium sp. DB0501]|uniref:putative bifunctional diguanylate cyclase/phosphodiesterase n=1 Tax=Methylobacterium sp. DB0501 TaxID=2709665 RepID=UPI0013EAAE2E|nr:EAL domain-containing protein [Methylobacterium sp. DB0501]NGM38509.1 EAL domain-containing protein [Methylobacterium sp. DB0501]